MRRGDLATVRVEAPSYELPVGTRSTAILTYMGVIEAGTICLLVDTHLEGAGPWMTSWCRVKTPTSTAWVKREFLEAA